MLYASTITKLTLEYYANDERMEQYIKSLVSDYSNENVILLERIRLARVRYVTEPRDVYGYLNLIFAKVFLEYDLNTKDFLFGSTLYQSILPTALPPITLLPSVSPPVSPVHAPQCTPSVSSRSSSPLVVSRKFRKRTIGSVDGHEKQADTKRICLSLSDMCESDSDESSLNSEGSSIDDFIVPDASDAEDSIETDSDSEVAESCGDCSEGTAVSTDTESVQSRKSSRLESAQSDSSDDVSVIVQVETAPTIGAISAISSNPIPAGSNPIPAGSNPIPAGSKSTSPPSITVPPPSEHSSDHSQNITSFTFGEPSEHSAQSPNSALSPYVPFYTADVLKFFKLLKKSTPQALQYFSKDVHDTDSVIKYAIEHNLLSELFTAANSHRAGAALQAVIDEHIMEVFPKDCIFRVINDQRLHAYPSVKEFCRKRMSDKLNGATPPAEWVDVFVKRRKYSKTTWSNLMYAVFKGNDVLHFS